MKRNWDNHELIEHWTIEPDEKELIRAKKGANRLGFALLLKFFQLWGRFPEKKNEIPRVVQTFVAEQLGLSADLYQEYNWMGRAIKYHRAEIRALSGFRWMQLEDFERLRQWLIDEVLPQEVDDRRLTQRFYEELRVQKIEPPTVAQVDRLLASARRQFEVHLCDSIVKQLSADCRQALDKLTGPQSDSWILDPDEIPLNRLKAEVGSVGLPSLEAELAKLEIIQGVNVPEALFSHLCESIVERYRLRVATESLTELRRHPDPIRYTLLAAFCWSRSQDVVDNVVELFILLVHRMESRSRKRASQEVLAKVEQQDDNHDKILYQIALASLAQPEGMIKEVIYPIADEERLEKVVEALDDEGKGTFRERLVSRLGAAYKHYYARMLPLILKAIEFRSDNEQLEPLLEALQLLKTHLEIPRKEPYGEAVNVPLEKVLSNQWQEAVMTTNAEGKPEVDRVIYELAILRTVREKLRCKELWVPGAKRYRNPDEDLPQDFKEKREVYYQDLQQPLDVEVFIDSDLAPFPSRVA